MQFAEAYNSQASFVSVVGDLNASTATLMKRLQVKSVPAFFFYKNGKEVSSFTGANKQGFRNNLSQSCRLPHLPVPVRHRLVPPPLQAGHCAEPVDDAGHEGDAHERQRGGEGTAAAEEQRLVEE